MRGSRRQSTVSPNVFRKMVSTDAQFIENRRWQLVPALLAPHAKATEPSLASN
jgi:hypothetical protein